MVKIFRFLFTYSILLFNSQNFTVARLSLSELQKVTSLLCKKFNVKNKLDIKYMPSDVYHMQYGANVVYVNQEYCEQISDSIVYFILLHEFRHYMQDSNGMFKRRTGLEKLATFYDKHLILKANKNKSSIWFPDDVLDIQCQRYQPVNIDDLKYVQEVMRKRKQYSFERTFKPYEYDAEMFAVQNVSCPVCYDIILRDIKRINISMEGYWGFNAMMKHRQSKENNQCCKAHSFSDNKESNKVVCQLYNALYTPSNIDLEEYKKIICTFDNQCGILSDRHTK